MAGEPAAPAEHVALDQGPIHQRRDGGAARRFHGVVLVTGTAQVIRMRTERPPESK